MQREERKDVKTYNSWQLDRSLSQADSAAREAAATAATVCQGKLARSYNYIKKRTLSERLALFVHLCIY